MFEYYYEYDGNLIFIALTRELSRDKDASIFSIQSKDSNFKFAHCVKKYHQPSPDVIDKLALMINHEGKYTFAQRDICWPQAFLKNQNHEIVGYVMPISKCTEALANWMIKPLRHKLFKGWHRNNLCDLLINILEKFKLLHEHYVLMGDLNDLQILIDPNDPTQSSFVHTDRYQIGKFYAPLGSPELAPADLQMYFYGNRHEETLARSVRQELYSIAVLLFKMLMFGQHPYVTKHQNDLMNNLKALNFPYPLGADFEGETPLGKSLDYWNMLSNDLKSLFYDVFKLQEHKSIHQWLNCIADYDHGISNLKYTTSLDEEAKIHPMGAIKIDDGRKKGEGDYQTNITSAEIPIKIAVLELSTRAVKFMIGSTMDLIDGFKWQSFSNQATLTNTGQLLNAHHQMDVETFKRTVLPHILSHVSNGIKQGVDRFYCVATAAYRMASNRTDILNLIKSEIQNKHHITFNIQILDRNQEANYTYKAYSWIKSDQINRPILLVDQGGGSTEITLFHNHEKIYSANVPLGTESMLRLLFVNNIKSNTLFNAIDEANKWSKRNIVDSMKGLVDEIQARQLNVEMVALGTAITKLTKKSSNQKQHDTEITLDRIQERKNELALELSLQIPSLADLEKFIHAKVYGAKGTSRDDAYELMIHMFGLMMYEHILTRAKLDRLVVNGAGLRYGVFKSGIDEIKEHPDVSKIIAEMKKEMLEYDGFEVGGIYDGRINGVQPYGCFVGLDPYKTGLLHVSKLNKRHQQLSDFHQGEIITVKVIKFIKSGEQVKIDLDLVQDHSDESNED